VLRSNRLSYSPPTKRSRYTNRMAAPKAVDATVQTMGNLA